MLCTVSGQALDKCQHNYITCTYTGTLYCTALASLSATSTTTTTTSYCVSVMGIILDMLISSPRVEVCICYNIYNITYKHDKNMRGI